VCFCVKRGWRIDLRGRGRGGRGGVKQERVERSELRRSLKSWRERNMEQLEASGARGLFRVGENG